MLLPHPDYLAVFLLILGVHGDDRTPLYIAGFLPVTHDHYYLTATGLPAAQIAVELINNSTDLLPDYELILEVYDSDNSSQIGLRRFFDMISRQPAKIFMLGPATSPVAVHVCIAAASWNIVQVSFSVRSSELEDRQLYPYFFRTVPSDAMLNPLRHQLLREFSWFRVAIIYEEDPGKLYYASLASLVTELGDSGVSVLTFQSVDKTNYAATLQSLKNVDARIIFAQTSWTTARELFCEVYRQGMYGGKYVWILPGWAGDQWWVFDGTHSLYNCTKEQLTATQEGHFSVNYLSYTSNDTSVLGMMVKDFLTVMKNNFGRISESSAYAFDAILTIGHVLHNSWKDRGINLSDFTYDSVNFSAVFAEELLKLEITGISGPIRFDSLGNRLGSSRLEQSQGMYRTLVGVLESNSEVINFSNHTPVTWIGSSVPRDGPIRSRSARFLPLAAITIISVLSAIGFAATCLFIAFNVKFGHLRCIKLSSPNMNNVVSIGCGLGYVSVILFGLDGRQLQPKAFAIICHARLFCLCVAYSLAFGSLFFKTWRVHRIMANKTLEKIKLKDHHLLAWVAALVLLDILFLGIWVTVDPLQRTLTLLPFEVDAVDSDYILEPFVEKCSCQNKEYWLCGVLVYKGLLLLFGLFLAWETRHIQVQALNDSKYIGMSVYNLAVISVVGVPVGFIISDEYYVGSYIISSIFIIMAVTITVCLVFVPKLYAVYQNPSGEVDVQFLTQRTTITGGQLAGNARTLTLTSSRVTPMAQAALNIALQHRLEKLVAEKDNQILQLQDQLASLKPASDSTIGIETIT